MDTKTRKKKIGIIHQGDKDRDSFMSANTIFLFLNSNLNDKYEPIDIFIDENNNWFFNGVSIIPSDLMHKLDLVWNLGHSNTLGVLNNLSIPNISIPAFTSTLKKSKEMFREHMQNTEVYIPNHFIIPTYQLDFDGPIENFAVKKAKQVFEKFSSPWIIRSFNKDISMGIHIAKTYPELVNAIIDGAEHGNSLLVEELINGKEATIHTLKNYRNEEIYTFGDNDIPLKEKEKLGKISKDLHQYLGDNNYFKLDFILTPRGNVYFKNMEFIPDFNEKSHFCESCEAVGIKPKNIIEHILD